jgi:hypothetical protein
MLEVPSRSPAKPRHGGALLSAMGLGAGRRRRLVRRVFDGQVLFDELLHHIDNQPFDEVGTLSRPARSTANALFASWPEYDSL